MVDDSRSDSVGIAGSSDAVRVPDGADDGEFLYEAEVRQEAGADFRSVDCFALHPAYCRADSYQPAHRRSGGDGGHIQLACNALAPQYLVLHHFYGVRGFVPGRVRDYPALEARQQFRQE